PPVVPHCGLDARPRHPCRRRRPRSAPRRPRRARARRRRTSLSGQGLTHASGGVRRHVSAVGGMAPGAGACRPRRRAALGPVAPARTDGAGAMNDGLGAPQSVLVLGGTSEIGLAVVRALAAGPLRTVVLAGRRKEALDEAADAVRATGVNEVDTVLFDADDTDSHSEVIDNVFDGHADIDVVLIAHGVLGDQEQAEQNPDEAVRILETNFVGSASLGLHAARRLKQQGHGTLVVLSSVAGERARRANFVYGSSKAGMDAFFQGLGDSLVGTGARVLIVRPGFVTTRMASGKEQAWAPPALRYVMFGVRHLPRPLFRKLKM